MEKYSAANTIWWVHNYHLGKNPFFTKALINISNNSRQKMIFQIHDFPECSRYKLLSLLRETIKTDLYPQNENVRYAVINKRDYQYLVEAGMAKSALFLLENPIEAVHLTTNKRCETLKGLSVHFAPSFPAWHSQQKYMLYPVRSIRRKNIAEAGLLSALSDRNIIVSLPGGSESERGYSNKCREMFTSGLVPGMFGIGLDIGDYDIGFEDLIASSSLIISSSIQEGFGYLFLNSMNWAKPLIARDLDILQDFKAHFSGYPSHFYKELLIPLDCHERMVLRTMYLQKLDRLKPQLREDSIMALTTSLETVFISDFVDFSYLTLKKQIEVLEKIQSDKDYKDRCKEINALLIQLIDRFFDTEPQENHKLLEKHWGYSSYCKRTEDIISSFDSPYRIPKKLKGEKAFYEKLQSYFTDWKYLRLLYDE